jgi:hypothetical protein
MDNLVAYKKDKKEILEQLQTNLKLTALEPLGGAFISGYSFRNYDVYQLMCISKNDTGCDEIAYLYIHSWAEPGNIDHKEYTIYGLNGKVIDIVKNAEIIDKKFSYNSFKEKNYYYNLTAYAGLSAAYPMGCGNELKPDCYIPGGNLLWVIAMAPAFAIDTLSLPFMGIKKYFDGKKIDQSKLSSKMELELNFFSNDKLVNEYIQQEPSFTNHLDRNGDRYLKMYEYDGRFFTDASAYVKYRDSQRK